MTLCRACDHPRLLHDSWGCKTKCGCGVSIIYLTPGPLGDGTPKEQEAVLEQGKLLDSSSDRLAELLVRAMYDRTIAERSAE